MRIVSSELFPGFNRVEIDADEIDNLTEQELSEFALSNNAITVEEFAMCLVRFPGCPEILLSVDIL